MAEGPFIKYTAFPGVVTERVITASDWSDVGLEGPDVRFNRQNRYMVDAGEMGLSDEVLQVFKDDPDFTVSESDKAPRLVGNTEPVGTSASTPSVKEGNEGSVGSARAGGTGGGAGTGGTAGGRR